MPDLSLDDELCAVVFAYLQRLRARYGGRIPRAELSASVRFRGERVPIWNYQKGIFKPAVLGRGGVALRRLRALQWSPGTTLVISAGHPSLADLNDPGQ